MVRSGISAVVLSLFFFLSVHSDVAVARKEINENPKINNENGNAVVCQALSSIQGFVSFHASRTDDGHRNVT